MCLDSISRLPSERPNVCVMELTVCLLKYSCVRASQRPHSRTIKLTWKNVLNTPALAHLLLIASKKIGFSKECVMHHTHTHTHHSSYARSVPLLQMLFTPHIFES